MNYIKHLNQWLELVSVDDRLSSSHVSVYIALFQLWNKNRFPDKISVFRSEVMQVSKIGSPKTYYKCLHALHDYGYIRYYPSYHPLKGSVIAINDLSDVEAISLPGKDGNVADNNDDTDLEPAKKICSSVTPTRVYPKQNKPSSCSKNDTGAAQLVAPLLINNINLINYKQRERRAHVKNELNSDFLKNKKKNLCQSSRALANSSPPEEAQQSRSVSSSVSGNRLESKKYVPREILIPTFAQVKEFFMYKLSGNYLDGVLDEHNRISEAEKFFHHYESNGWLLGGKVPMRNWKASCRSWAAKIPYFSKTASKSSFVIPERKNFHVERFDNYAEPL